MSTETMSAPVLEPAGRAHDADGHDHGLDSNAAPASPVKDQIECAKRPPPVFLHSPPDSNNATKTDDSDSELSDLEDEPVLDHAPQLPVEPVPQPEPQTEQSDAQPEPEPKVEPEDDIGEVLPDHWSGAVPVFKPNTDQFKDFKRFVRPRLPTWRIPTA